MKMIVAVALALVAVVAALPVEDKPAVEVVSSTFEQSPDGGYKRSTALTDGSAIEEQAVLKEVTNEKNEKVNVLEVRGSYSIPKGDGTLETVEYKADENGYRARGPSIPKIESQAN